MRAALDREVLRRSFAEPHGLAAAGAPGASSTDMALRLVPADIADEASEISAAQTLTTALVATVTRTGARPLPLSESAAIPSWPASTCTG